MRKKDKYIDQIVGSGQHLLQLINDILDISILDVGELELNEDDIVIAPLVGETVVLIKSQADAKQHRVVAYDR